MDIDDDNILINDSDTSHNDNDSIVSDNSGTDVITNTFHHSNNIANEIDLLKLIIDMGAPLYAYERIMKWAKESYMSKYTFDSKHKTYQQTINYLENQLQFNICRPIKIPVKLSQDQFLIDVVVFDIKKMLASLFDDPTINQKENLVISSPNRFSQYKPTDNRFGEVNSGTWYATAYNNCIKDPDTDFLCPIILASDKTTLSEIGDLHVDAIFMTTSLFNLKVCISFIIFGFLIQLSKIILMLSIDKKQS